MRSDPETGSLQFGDSARHDPKEGEKLFERWVASRTAPDTPPARRLRASSVRVYRAMWRKFLRFASTRGGYPDVDAREIERFLKEPGSARNMAPNELTAWRYLKLLSELLELARQDGARRDNPAAAIMAAREPPEREEKAPVVLDAVQETAVRQVLDHQPQDEGHWKDLRDWALLNVVLGGGLKPYEARSLSVDDVHWRAISPKERAAILAIAGHGATPPRETPLSKRAGEAVEVWMRERAKMPLEGGRALFPANLTGEPVGSSEVYRATERLFERAKIDARDGRRGLQVLRATFAAVQLGQGQDKERVSAWMGLASAESVERYTNRRTARSRERPI